MNITSGGKSQLLAIIRKWLLEWSNFILNEKSLPVIPRNSRRRIQRSDANTPIAGARFFADLPAGRQADQNDDHQTFPKIVVTPNPEMIAAAQKDSEFCRALNFADLAIPDGIGVVAALRLLSSKFNPPVGGQSSKLQRISGLDFMESLIKEAVKHRWRVVFLGGKPGVAAVTADKLRITNYELRITSLSGPQDIAHASQVEMNHLISRINSIKPHLLFVAFGHPKQEKWMSRYRNKIQAGVMMGVGGALDQIADPSLRPPAYANSIGCGWLHRLVRQPWRIKRQTALLKFVFMLLKKIVLNLPIDKKC